jgi:hypothetical protein
MKTRILAGIVLVALVLSACVPGSEESRHAAAGGLLSQILLGFWQGIIAPITLLIEVINHFAPHALPWQLHMYESAGTGWAYDVGFYFGLLGGPGAILGGWSRR